MKPTSWIACGALLAGLAVAAGAFGAHGLTSKLKNDTSLSAEEAARRLDIFETAARYQMYHALAILFTGLLATRQMSSSLTVAGCCFLFGVIVFSGCLYAIALGGPKLLGAIVPIGGVSFIVGWICLAIGAFQAD
ncbi:MAG TPA: DUF423 domain-containing protein [Pirellulales bacterium]|nr:DUF423 domain-containing protein [Pirellulales bacterium]